MEKKINYRGLFIAGIIFLCSGVVLMITLGPIGISLLAVGIMMMAIGLSHREEWEQDS